MLMLRTRKTAGVKVAIKSAFVLDYFFSARCLQGDVRMRELQAQAADD